MKALLGALCLAALVAAEGEAGITVSRHAFARDVVGKEPVGVATSFPADVGRLYFFTQFTGASGPTEVLHVWLYDGREVAIFPLEVGGSPWRTWTIAAIGAEQRGDWTVEVREVGGRVLFSSTCRIE